MRKILFFLGFIFSLVFSLFIATNYCALTCGYPPAFGHFDLLGRLYYPWRVFGWIVKYGDVGGQYKRTFWTFLISEALCSTLLIFLYAGLKSKTSGLYGTSRWRTHTEMKKAGYFSQNGGTILGQSKSAKYLHLPPSKKGPSDDCFIPLHRGKLLFNNTKEHILVVAPTRRGKGISTIIPSLLSWTNSVIVYDIKKENYHVTAGWRRLFSYIVRFEPASPNSAHYNSLQEIPKGDEGVSAAQNMVHLLANPSGSEMGHSDSYWTHASIDLLTGVALYLVNTDGENGTFPVSWAGVLHFLSNPQRSLHESLSILQKSNILAVAEAGKTMLDKSENDLSGVKSTAVSYLGIFQDPIVAANTNDSDFLIEDLITADHPISLYLCVAPKDESRMTPIVRMFLQTALSGLNRDLDKPRHKMLFLVDEFPSLGCMPFFEKSLATCAGFNIKCMLIVQSFSQIKKIYGRENGIIANCRYKCILGADEPEEAKYISEYLGSYSIMKDSVSKNGNLGSFVSAGRSVSTTEAEAHLMRAEDILRMKYEDFILLDAGAFPYKGKKIMYYSDKRFKSRANMAAPTTRADQLRELFSLGRQSPIEPRKVEAVSFTSNSVLPAPNNSFITISATNPILVSNDTKPSVEEEEEEEEDYDKISY